MKLQSPYYNKRIIVTGGAGFIGSHIAEILVEHGAHVTIIDNLSTGSLTNLAACKNAITFYEADIRDTQHMLELTRHHSTIFHCAAQVSVPESFINTQDCYSINHSGTFSLLEACRINKIETFVLSSSAAVYGNDNGICKELNTCHPTSPYGYSKWMGELLCQQYAKLFGINTICLRYFNVFGERQNPQSPYAGVYARFRNALANNEPITIYGDGNQERDFIPVEEIAAANLLLGTTPHVQGHVFNIGTGVSISLLQLISILKQEFPAYSAPILFAQPRNGDIYSSRADCTKYYTLKQQSQYPNDFFYGTLSSKRKDLTL